MTTPAHQAAARIRQALEAFELAMGASQGIPAREVLIRACSPDSLRALLAERDELAKDAARLGAELECYRSTFGQKDTGMKPLGEPSRLTDAQYARAHNVKLLAAVALGRPANVPLRIRRGALFTAIDVLAELTPKD